MRTSLLVRSTALLAVAGVGLAGCSGGDATEKVASSVTSEATDDARDGASADPTEEPGDDPSEDATDDSTDGSSPGGTSVDGTQVVDLAGVGKELTLEIPEGWQPSDAADGIEYIVFVALSPDPYESFSANVVVTVEPAPARPEDIFTGHDAAALGYDSTEPDGSTGTIAGYPSHTVSGLLEGPSGEDLAQSSTVILVDGDDGTTVALALALTTHADDTEGQQTLEDILYGATVD